MRIAIAGFAALALVFGSLPAMANSPGYGPNSTIYPPAPGVGTDASSPVVNSTGGLVALKTFTVVYPGQYRCWNNSANVVMVAYASAGGPSIQAVSPSTSGAQGGDTSPEIPWFTGSITVYGVTGSIVPCIHN
jgi:hypothetical protein